MSPSTIARASPRPGRTPANARARRILLAADTWLERQGLAMCLQAAGLAGEAVDGIADLREFTRGDENEHLLLVAADPFERLIRSELWIPLQAQPTLHFIVVCASAERRQAMQAQPLNAAHRIEFVDSADAIGRALSRLPGLRRSLSSRRQEVLVLLQRGHRNKDIAAQLGIAPGTVKNHVSALLKELGVRNRTQAALAQPTARPKSPAEP